MEILLGVAPLPRRHDDVALDALRPRRLAMRQFPLGDAVGPVAEVLERNAAEHLRERVQHERRGLARLHAADPRLLPRLELAERGRNRPGGQLAELMAADAASVLHHREPIALGDVRGDVALAAELIGVRDLEHRVPVDRRVVLRRRRRGRRHDRAEIQLLARLGIDLRRIDEAVAADPHLVFGLRKVGHHVAALVVGDDDSRKPGRKLRRLGDDPDTGLGPARPGDHAADVVTIDGHRSAARLLGAELHDRAGPEHNDHKCRHPQPQRSLRLRHRATPFVPSTTRRCAQG